MLNRICLCASAAYARPVVLLLCLCCLLLPGRPSSAAGRSVPASEASASAPSSLDEHIATLAAGLEKRTKAIAGVSAVDLASGKSLGAHREDELFIPASNMKLLTSFFALAKLGSDFDFRTAVYLSGRDIVVVGDFDPTLGDPVLAAAENKTIYADLDIWVQGIKAKVGDTIAGDLLVVSRGEVKSYRHKDWPRDQYDRWYGAPVAQMNFNNNCMDIKFDVKAGEATPVLSPSSRFIKVANSVKPGKGPWSARLSSDDSAVSLTGTAGAGGEPVSVPVNNPPMLLGRTLADRLEQAGVHLGGQVRKVEPDQVNLPSAKLLVTTRTSLAMAMTRANKRSLNMAAESIFLRSGDGTWEGSAKIATETLCKSFGLKETSFHVADGSGFSRNDRVSPQAMTTMLQGALRLDKNGILLKSLPISGTDGTIAKRFDNPRYRGRVLGKTGYIAGVSCLSGYILDKQGKPSVAYSVLVNKCVDLAAAKHLEEEICERLVDYVDSRP